MNITVSRTEFATILAALRMYGSASQGARDVYHDIASDGGDLHPLWPRQVDALAERLNGPAE